MKKNILIIFISAILITGCDRTFPCYNQFVTPAFIGFKLSDLDTVIVREYEKGNNFSHLLDTAIIISDTTFLKSATSNDTTIILLNHISGEEKEIFPDHDWQIYIPAQNLVVSMSNFASPQKTKKCLIGGDLCPGCSNPIDSFLQNGQKIIPQYGTIKYYGNYYVTYIHH